MVASIVSLNVLLRALSADKTCPKTSEKVQFCCNPREETTLPVLLVASHQMQDQLHD